MKAKHLSLILCLVLAAVLAIGCSSKDTQGSSSDTSRETQGKDSSSGSKSDNGNNGSSKEIELKAVTAWAKETSDNAGLFEFIKIVNEKGKGKVHIKYLGGPEVIPLDQQTSAVQNGTVDISWLSAGYTTSVVPAASALKLSKLSPQQERKQGVTDLWQKIYKQANAHFLLRGSSPDVHFHIYTTVPIKTLSDFEGAPIRTTAVYEDFLSALGAAPVSTTPGEVYTSLQNGVVKGYGWPAYGIADLGWDKLTKYIIDPGFYQVDCFGMMNLDKWNSLPEDVKQIMNDAAIQVEKDMGKHFVELSSKDREDMTQKGIKVIKLNQQEAKEYVQLAYSSAWNELLKDAPEFGPQIKKALGQ